MTDNADYRRPPKEYQFKKGVSGNPHGRPKAHRITSDGSIALMLIIKEAMDRIIKITENGKIKRLSVRQILIKKLAHNALNDGDTKAIDLLLKWVEKADRAAFEGQTGEPPRIVIEGGLPDNEPPPPAH